MTLSLRGLRIHHEGTSLLVALPLQHHVRAEARHAKVILLCLLLCHLSCQCSHVRCLIKCKFKHLNALHLLSIYVVDCLDYHFSTVPLLYQASSAEAFEIIVLACNSKLVTDHFLPYRISTMRLDDASAFYVQTALMEVLSNLTFIVVKCLAAGNSVRQLLSILGYDIIFFLVQSFREQQKN